MSIIYSYYLYSFFIKPGNVFSHNDIIQCRHNADYMADYVSRHMTFNRNVSYKQVENLVLKNNHLKSSP